MWPHCSSSIKQCCIKSKYFGVAVTSFLVLDSYNTNRNPHFHTRSPVFLFQWSLSTAITDLFLFFQTFSRIRRRLRKECACFWNISMSTIGGEVIKKGLSLWINNIQATSSKKQSQYVLHSRFSTKWITLVHLLQKTSMVAAVIFIWKQVFASNVVFKWRFFSGVVSEIAH